VCISKSGLTGLSEYAMSTEIGAGPGPAYVSSIHVKAGETYYLMVDFGQEYLSEGRSPAGFKIYFYNYYPKRKPIVLNNIFFETGKSVLQKESFPELDKLVLMLAKSQMVIEVRGHTDNAGDEKKNQLLSEERAKAVVDYLVSNKINKKRLFYKGFGSTKPIATNATQEGRQKNRRVEFIKVMY
jgi:outer membrane protein OmpA-like peptidoglycan-associated protein